MSSTRLAPESGSVKPTAAIVAAVRARPRADALLYRIHALLDDSSGPERTLHLEPDLQKLALMGFARGAFGSPLAATSLAAAVSQAGYWKTVEAGLTAAYLMLIHELGRPAKVPLGPFFHQAVACAAFQRGVCPGDEADRLLAYGSGLLQNVGVLGFAAWRPEDFGKESLVGLEAERGTFGIDHSAAGLAILIFRQFPNQICESAAFHHGDLGRISPTARRAAAAEACATRLGSPSFCGPVENWSQVHREVFGWDETAEFLMLEEVRQAREGARRLFA